MPESERKRIKAKRPTKIQRDPSMKGGARGGDEEARRQPEEEPEVPIIQRYSE